MKTGMWSLVLIVCGLSVSRVQADEAKFKVNTPSDNQDTSIVIHKGPGNTNALTPTITYKIVQETEDISGDPSPDRPTSYKSWKKACEDWRKDLKETNGKLLLSSNCGTPHIERDNVTLEITQTSTGTYKLKVSLTEPVK